MEILYPHSWYNVRQQDAWFGIGLRNTDETEEITTTRTRIEAGYYQGPQILVKTKNDRERRRGLVHRNDTEKNGAHPPQTYSQTRRMAFVHQQSCEGLKSELDLFSVPTTQTSIESGQWVEHQPLTALDAGVPSNFAYRGRETTTWTCRASDCTLERA